MELTLRQWYFPDEAVAAFGGGTAAEFLCDGQFVVLPKVILCFVTVGDAPTEPHVYSPSCVVWKPRRLDYDPSDEYPWLPEKAREVWDLNQKEVRKIRDHHVFVRSPADERFFNAGRAHLGSYGGPTTGGTAADRSADFSLNEKLPRYVWLRLGGYPGWEVEVNHQIHRVDNGDVDAFRHLAEGLLRQEFSHLRMTRYEEDSLTVHTNTAHYPLPTAHFHCFRASPRDMNDSSENPGCARVLAGSLLQTPAREDAGAPWVFIVSGRVHRTREWLLRKDLADAVNGKAHIKGDN